MKRVQWHDTGHLQTSFSKYIPFYMDVAEGFVCKVNVPVLPRALMKPYVVVIYKEFILEFKEDRVLWHVWPRHVTTRATSCKKGFPQNWVTHYDPLALRLQLNRDMLYELEGAWL